MVNINMKCCDNLELMATIKDKTVDLIYCDILYGTGRKFDDYQDLKLERDVIKKHYIKRVKEMHRILKDTGSIYLQMDTRINHWMRIILDSVFGYKNFQNEIAWVYRAQGFSRTKWSEKHDVVLFYSKTKDFTFNLEDVRENEIGESTQKRWHKEIAEHGLIPTKKNGKVYWNSPYSPPRDWIDMNALPQAHSERNGYNTQKPMELIERFIKASSNKGDLVADFYAGSFTTAEVCACLGRNFVGCDINPKAIEIGRERITNGFEKDEARGQINLWDNAEKQPMKHQQPLCLRIVSNNGNENVVEVEVAVCQHCSNELNEQQRTDRRCTFCHKQPF